ncbi:MAG: LPP20 family lipoprotein [Spirochaetaceae bacterium]|jgi:hypothetical protein|nr:LPP20 family lipoprotein [Spirochaetaceae bacterium]
MFKINNFFGKRREGGIFAVCAVLIGCVILFGCAGSAKPASSGPSLADSRAAAYEAIDAMNSGGRNAPAAAAKTAPAAGIPAAANAPAAGASGSRAQPGWVSSPYSVYDQDAYVAAVGYGENRTAAERSALVSLTAVFGQSVQAEISTITNYSEAVNNGSINVSENNAVREAIKTSSEMDSLIGVEIADVWQNGADRSWSAVAVLEKQKSAVLYADLIRGNQRLINEITNIPDADKNSLEAFSRYRLAATVADTNKLYANLLSVLGSTPSGLGPSEIKGGNDYRLEAAKLARNIPIAVKVEGDRQNRIGNAFAVALGRIGFKSGGTNNRYVLNAALSLDSANLPGNQHQFCRYNIDAYLTDTVNNSKLSPYNISGREGHTVMSEAEVRAVNSASKKIDAEFEQVFDNFFSTNLLR